MKKVFIVIGDLFLDSYHEYKSIRKSPEANAPVLVQNKIKYYLGGAGNVASNLTSFNENVLLLSFFQKDRNGGLIKKLIKRKKIYFKYFIKKNYKNITKERLLSNNIQIARIDNEKQIFTNSLINLSIKKFISKNIYRTKGVIISDYRKGFINKKNIKIISDICRSNNVPLFADPKSNNPTHYKNVNFLSPNYKEFLSFYPKIKSKNKIKQIFKQSNIDYLIITKGKLGSICINKRYAEKKFKAQKVKEVDVSGAGDTFISSFAYAFCKTRDVEKSMIFANNMSADVVSQKYIAVPRRKIFLDNLRKITKKNNFLEKVYFWKKKKYKIGLTNGCFDLFHPGHAYLLNKCKKYCDKLIVLLNSDSSIKLIKGKDRPLENLNKRRINILKNINVDMCLVFTSKTPLSLIKKIIPNIIFKGDDYNYNQVIGFDLMKNTNGKVLLFKKYKNFSTTNLIKKSI
jgi:D-beta-D-heptose 7-phosphate kinase/D-beta-D-heptose 1-phosphate adenosyltransferase